MTDEEFYGKSLPVLKEAEKILLEMVDRYPLSKEKTGSIGSVLKCQSRIKSSRSMIEKLKRRNLEISIDSALNQVHDAVGIRIICGFIDDVYDVAEWIAQQPEVVVLVKKDYISYPKPNGYRSYHLRVQMTEGISEGIFAEIQIRTMAIDFWATLEHELKYKKEIKYEKLIRKELKRCADEIAATDLSMQTIRDMMEYKGE